MAGQALTYTAVPPGGSLRAGVDRDEDGYFDRDEIDAGSDPADPLSIPASPTATPTVSATATQTPTATPTQTPTVTETPADTPTLAATATATPTDTSAPPVNTATPTVTDTATLAPTLTETATATATPTPTLTETATATATATTALCTSGVTITEVQLKISRNLVPAGDERLKIKGEMQLAALSPPIDPVANGLEISVADQSGAPLFDLPIPGGALWQANGSGTRWTYRDRDGTVGGIIKVVLTQQSAGLFRLKVVGRDGNFHLVLSQLPLRLQVVLGGSAQLAADQCAALSFNPSSGPSPRCVMSGSRSAVRCK